MKRKTRQAKRQLFKNFLSIGTSKMSNEILELKDIEKKEHLLNDNVNNNIAIGWINLTYFIKILFKDYKIILNNINGKINFGQLTALMGPSGCGKTTLLKCINGFNWSRLSDNTKMFVNKSITLRKCFIVQNKEEHLLMNLTVYESLKYSYLIKNKTSNNMEDKINEIINDLLMSDCCNNLVRNCSSGEQKRLSIGLELTSNNKPNLICIDEPTSGLDSYAAQQIISCLRQLAINYQIAIITSIHQPNNDVLSQFDNLYVLSKYGICIYDGSPYYLKDHLSLCHINIAEWQKPIEVLICVGSKIEDNQKHNEQIEKMQSQVFNKQHELESLFISECKQLTSSLKTNTHIFDFVHFYHLLCRSCKHHIIRGWKFHLIVFTFTFALSIFQLSDFPSDVGADPKCLQYDQNYDFNSEFVFNLINGKENKLLDNSFFIYQSFAILTAIFYLSSVFTYPKEIKIFLNEHRNGWYSTSSYYLARTFIQTPIILLNIYLIYWVVYYGSSQHEMKYWYQGIWDVPDRFMCFLIFCCLVYLVTQFSAMTIGIAFAKKPGIAVLITMIFYMIMDTIHDTKVDPTNHSNILVRLLGHLHTNLGFRSALIVLYQKRCPSKSQLLKAYSLEEDDLVSYYCYFSIQVFFWICLGYFLLYLKSNWVDCWDLSYVFKRRFSKFMENNNSYENKVFSSSIVINNEQSEINETPFELTIKNETESESAFGWIDLTCQKRSCLKYVKILNNLSGKINFSTLTGLLGPSGAGKTTLLECMNGFISSGFNAETKFYENSHKKLKSCFINQDQKKHLLINLTVKESIYYASKIKNCRESVNHKEIVNKILTEMLLTKCANNIVSKCSGGELKRLSIGLELTSKTLPNFLLIDEPTTGLDTYSAEQVMMCLQRLAHNYEISIITSIHQPNNNILMLFDQIYVLTKGSFIFNGRPISLRQHLIECDISCTSDETPIEKLIKISLQSNEKENEKFFNSLIQKTRNDLLFTEEILKKDCNLSSNVSGRETQWLSSNVPGRETQCFNVFGFVHLLQRELKHSLIRKWKFQLITATFLFAIILILISLYPNDIGTDPGCEISIDDMGKSPYKRLILETLAGKSQRYVKNVLYLPNMFLFINIILMVTSTITFTSSFQVFLTEHHNNWYSASTYYLSKNLAEIPFLVIVGYIYIYIGYFSTSQPDMSYWYQGIWDIPCRFQLFLLFTFLALFTFQGIIFTLCIIFSNSFKLSLVSLSVVLGVLMSQMLASDDIPFLNYFQLWFKSILTIIYRHRCQTRPVVFNIYQVNESDLWENFYQLVFYLFSIRFFNLFLFILRANFYKLKCKFFC